MSSSSRVLSLRVDLIRLFSSAAIMVVSALIFVLGIDLAKEVDVFFLIAARFEP